jgi:hypothetical protein
MNFINKENTLHVDMIYIPYRRGCDRIVVEFTKKSLPLVPITTKVVSSNLVHGEVYSIQYYVIK